jgi:hypothetical protein
MRGAAEITAAADAESIELWNLINGQGRWIEPAIVGGWVMHLFPDARVRRIRAELPGILATLEATGIRQLHLHPDEPFAQVLSTLGIARLRQGPTDFPGSIYPNIELPLERTAGYVPDTGDPLVSWLEKWLAGPSQVGNLNKLAASGAQERHLFVIHPGFTTAPFVVTDLLMREDAPLPEIAPDLPAPLTHTWTASTWAAGVGMRWSPEQGWARFTKDV